MKRIDFILFLFTLFSSLFAQESFKISKPDLSFENNILTIKYDVIGCGNNEYVNIRMIILNSKGDTINPVYISGDIGKQIVCGIGKSILWDLEKERIALNDDISVLIKGEKYNPPTPAKEIISNNPKKFTRENVFFSTVLVPGLGQSKVSGKNCYFVFSGLVYGSLGTSIYFATRSEKYKEYYHAAIGSTERDDLYNKWQNSYNMSKYFAIGSVGVWLTNIIWSAAIPINDNAGRKMNVYFFAPEKNEFYLSAKWNF